MAAQAKMPREGVNTLLGRAYTGLDLEGNRTRKKEIKVR